MILLDTHAVIWLHQERPRVAALAARPTGLYASPATLLELQVLVEVGRLRPRRGKTVADILSDERWLIDEPPAGAWFSRSLELGWTRDPFDRLLAAHALLRGWRLATADTVLLEHLPANRSFEL